MNLPHCNTQRKPYSASSRLALWGVFAAWALLVFVPIGYLMGFHWVALPVAEEAIALPQARDDAERSWTLVHVLGEECQCSQDVLSYLLERGATSHANETVLLLGGRVETKLGLEARGYRVMLADAEELCATYGSEGVPFFQVLGQGEELFYSGAYVEMGRIARQEYLDLRNLALAQEGVETPNLPVIGCATSRRLQGTLDPLALKYDSY